MGLAVILGLLAFFALCSFAIWRRKKNRKAAVECLALMPPSRQLTLSLASDASRVLPSLMAATVEQEKSAATDVGRINAIKGGITSFLWDSLTPASIIDGALAGLPVFHAFNSIDPAVLNAVQASTADHLHSLPSIHSYVQQHFFDAPHLSADGWLERLSGYVMEQKTASALEAAGHHVTFAATANQPAWDLLVDGKPVQVKEGLAGVKSYLAEHHGIPIYTGSEAAGAVKDPLVHGIHGLDSSAIHDVTHHSLDGIAEGFSPDIHIPLVTVAVSSYREVKLLISGSTTLLRASCNVGIDTAGVGTGMFAGAKAGALGGSLFGPPGAAFGGFIGAVAGGIGGKIAATGLRQAPFKKAKEKFEHASARVEQEMQTAISESEKKVRELQTSFEAESAVQRGLIMREAQDCIQQRIAAYDGHIQTFVSGFSCHLDDLLVAIDYDAARALMAIPGSGVIGAFVRPTANDHLRGAIVLWRERAKAIVVSNKARIAAIVEKNPGEALKEIAAFLQKYTFQLDLLDADLEKLVQTFYETQMATEALKKEAADKVLAASTVLLRRFSAEVETMHTFLANKMRSFTERLTPLRERLVVEGRAIGLSLD